MVDTVHGISLRVDYPGFDPIGFGPSAKRNTLALFRPTS
jgi:hypothetical protein